VGLLKTIGRVLARLGRDRPLAFGLVVGGAAVAGIQVIESVLFGRVIDAFVGGAPVGAVLALWAGLGVVGLALNVCVSLLADRLAHRHRLWTLSAAFNQSLRRLEHRLLSSDTGETLRNILVGSDGFFQVYLSGFREVVPAIAALIILIPVAMSISPTLTLTLFTLMAVQLIANTFVVEQTQSGQRAVDVHHRSLSGRITDVVANANVVHAFTLIHAETRALNRLIRNTLEQQYPVLTWWAILSVFTRGAATLSVVTIFLVGSFLVGRGDLTIGQVVTFAGFSTLMITRLEQATGAIIRIVPLAPVMEQLLGLLDTIDAERADRRLPAFEPGPGHIRFEDVSYTFPGTQIGVHDISLEIAPGEQVALVGPTGAGKTTLISLVQRLIRPTGGSVLIDGQDIAGVRGSTLRAAISVVAQDVGLFNRTVAENLRIARPDATDAELEAALRDAELWDMISTRPEGLEFRIGERGARLSGGERQRLSIARALLKKSSIVILDEATSALDNVTQARVQRALERVTENATTFIIAHRLSTVRQADRILVMADGRIVQMGTFDSLAAEPGLFHELAADG
jgi:ATP-binding cassette subfamily B protein